MGYACEYPTDEDTLCAEYLQHKLADKPSRFNEMVEIIRTGSGARFFEDSKQAWAPKVDFDLCLHLNRFNFVLKVEQNAGVKFLRKIEPPF
jgi:2-phosphosulfolactate phosphatase